MPNFGLTPTSTTPLSNNQFPVSAGFVPNTASGNLTSLQLGPATTDNNGYISAPVATYTGDGSDINAGGTTDAAVTGDVSGSISAKLRGLSKIFAQLQFDGSNYLKVDVAAGTVAATQSGTWNVTNISGTISLPTGAAADSSVNGILLTQASTTSGQKGPLVQGAVTTGSPSYTTAQTSPFSLTTSGALRVDATATTQPISAASLPLPTGAATSAKQPALGTAGSASTDVLTVQGITSMTALKVDGSGVAQPVSGTITANAGTGSFTVAQATGSNLHAVLDSGSTTAVTQATASSLNAQVVGSVASGGSNAGNPVKTGGVYNSTQPTVTTGQIVDRQSTARGALIVATGVDAFAVNASQSGTWNITNVSGTISLPTGAATSAKQPALGTAGSASTDVLTVQGIASMTALKVDGSAVTQPISGTVTANAGTGTFNIQQSNITTDYDTGAGTQTMTMFGMALPASGGAVAGGTASNPLKIDPTGTTTQPVSGTVTANAGTGTFTIQSNASVNVNQIAGSSVATAATGIMKVGLTDGTGTAITSTSNAIDVNIKSGGGSGFSVTDETAWTAGTSAFVPTGGVFNDTATALTSGQEGAIRLTNNRAIHVNLRDASANQLLGSKTSANSLPVVVASDQGAVAIGVASGTALTADQTNTILKTSLYVKKTAAADTVLTLGSATSANSVPVVIASDQGAVPASQSGTWNITNISGTVSLPTGAATSAKQPALGTAGSASSDVLTVQGIASMTALKVDGSAVTQPVSGTITANAGSGTFNIQSNASVNVAQIAGSSISTATTGVQKVGIVGNAGASIDSTVGAGSAPTNAIVTGAIYNSSAPAPTSGQAMALQVDQAGNQRIFPGVALATLSAWNSSTSLNATQTILTNSGAEAVLVQLTQTTTLTAGAVTFEVSYDGSTWQTIPASCVLDPTSSTFAQISLPYAVQASTNKAILLNSNGAQGLRIKLSTQITGTGTVTPNYALLPASPADTVIALSPTAANFNVAVGAMPTSATGTLTSVAASASNTQLLASNTSRKAAYFFNDSSAIMYLAFNATASTTSYTVQVPGNGFFEMPIAPVYTGQINAVWSSATGNARISEMS